MPKQTKLSIELLRTFTILLDQGCNTTATRRILRVNQPSLSKRLQTFQRPGKDMARPWLVRKGKTWKATPEGQRVRQAVVALVARYDHLMTFIQGTEARQPGVHFACGQLADRKSVV